MEMQQQRRCPMGLCLFLAVQCSFNDLTCPHVRSMGRNSYTVRAIVLYSNH